MNPTLLIAEDDDALRDGLKDLFEAEGYDVLPAGNGQTALELWRQYRPMLIVLDVMMPELNGFEVCQQIRRDDTHTPILFLTAKAQEIDQVVGLKLGGDDYVTKPFGMQALLARVEALQRRAARGQAGREPDALPDEFPFGEAVVSRKRHQITRADSSLPLTLRELKLLELFYDHPGEVINRNRLLNEVWGIDYFGTTRTLDQHIAQLRKKVEADPRHPTHLLTVHGVGYRYAPP